MATESLEDRTLLTFVSILAGTDVTFQGSNGDDTLTLREEDGTGLLEFSTNGSAFSTDLGGGSTISVASITSLTINGNNNNDTIDLSDLDGLTITAQVTGGHGNDSYATGSADVDFLYSGSNNSFDSFTANGSGTSTILALGDNTVIGLASGFNNGVDVIDVDGKNSVRVDGTNNSDVLNFANVNFTNFSGTGFQVFGGNNNDTITTSNLSDGVRYQGGHGNDNFIIGDADATFLYAGSNNGFDSFSGNDGDQTATMLALGDNAVIGLASGFNNGVDVIDIDGKNSVRVDGTNNNDVLNFAEVSFTNFAGTSFQVFGGNNNDTITTSNLSDGVRYQGGHGNDNFIIGDADAIFLYAGSNNGFDSFTGNDGDQDTSILALGDNAVIGLASGFINGVDEINIDNKNNVRVDGTTSNDVLNFADVNFTNFLGTNFQVFGGNQNDTITTSNHSDGVRYQGGHGNDNFIIGDADAIFLYTGANNSFDSFSGNDGDQATTILALNDNTVIGLASGFNNGVDVINVDNKNNVRVDGTNNNDVLNFADVNFTNFLGANFKVFGGNNHDTITTSNHSDGVQYQGGHGNDNFIIGDADATFLYTGANNSFDSFSGNDGDQTTTILALSDNTVIGLANGFDNGVDVISDGGNSGVKVFGTNNSDTHNFEDVVFSSTLLIYAGNNNDTVTSSLDRGHTITYDGAHGNDTLFFSLSNAEAQDAVVQSAIADFIANFSSTTPYTFGIDGPSSVLDGITIQNFETVKFPLVVSGAGDYRVVRNNHGSGTADDEVEIYRDGNLIANQLLDFTSEVIVIGATNSSDSLEVDFSGGDPIPVNDVTFNGLGGSGSDELFITNGSHLNTIYNYTNANDGNIDLDGSVIVYTGLEPITNTGTTDNAIFNLTGGNNVATLTDNGATSSLTGTTFENTTFTNPAFSLTINGGGGTDQLLLGSIYSVGLDLFIDAETVTLGHDVTVDSFTSTGNTLSTGTNKDIRATEGNIDITTSTGKIDIRGLLDAKNSGIGAITLDAATSVSVTGTVTTDGGDFTSSGTSLIISGITSVGAGDVDLDGHTGAITLGGDVTGASFSAIGGTTLSTGTNDDIRATAGNIDITTSTGKIDVRGLLDAKDSGTAAITLDAATTVSVTGSVTTDGGDFTSSGTSLIISGITSVGAGDVDLDGHTGAITLGGDVTGASFSAIGGTTLNTGTNDDIRATAGNIDITTSTGKIDIRGLLDAKDSGTAAITLDAATTVSISSTVTTDGGDFTSSGTNLTISGITSVGTGDVDLDGHTGAITLGGDVTGASFSATGGTTLSTGTNDDIRATAGNIDITTSTGKIDIRGLLDAKDSGTAAITLDAATTVSISSTVTTDGGDFTSSGTNLTISGITSVGTGDVDLDGHTGAITLGGDVTGASFSATGGTTLSTGTNDDIRATAGNIDITTSTGKIDIRGVLDAKNSGTGAIALDATTTVSVTGSVTTDGGDFTSSGTNLTIGGFVTTAGGNIDLDHGNVTLQSDVNTGGGDFTSGNGTGNLTTGTNDDIRTFGGNATFDHKDTTIGGLLDTAGGDLNITLYLVSANFGPILFSTASGNINFSSNSIITIDVSAIDLADNAPFDQFDVIRAINGDIIDSGLTLVSGQDANGDDTAFVQEILVSGSSETLRLTGAPLLPIIVSGAGDYVLQLEDNNTPSTNDDLIVLYRDTIEIARRAYFATTFVDITGATGTSDSLTIDFDGGAPVLPGLGTDGGNPIPVDGVTFNGLGGAGSDTLILDGGTFDSLTYSYDNANDGDIELVDGSVTSIVNFLGLDPIIDTTTAATKTFNLLGGNDTVSLSRVNATTSVLAGTTIEDTTFTNPTDLLVINGDSGTDTINVNGSDLDLGTAGIDLTAEFINVQTGLTAASVATSGINLSVSNTKDITATEGNIAFTQTGNVTAAGSDLSAANSSNDASITIDAGNGNHDVAVRSITTDGGSFTSSSGRHLTVNADINTGTGAVDIDHGGNVTLKGHVTAGTFQSDGVTLTVSNTKNINVSGVLGSGEGIDINHIGIVNMAGTDLVSTAVGAIIDIVAGIGNHDVSVRSVSTNNGDFISTGGRSFTANWDINTGTGIVDLNHTGGNVELKGHVTASTFQSDGVNLTVSNTKDIKVSGVLGSGEGIDVNHTGIVNMAGTDLVSTSAGASIDIVAGNGNHDVSVRSVSTNNGDFISTGGRNFTANWDINTGTGIVDLNHTGGNVELKGHVTASTFQSDGVNLTVSNTKDIKVSSVLGSGEGIDVNHTGIVNMAGTDLVSTAAGASVNIVAGNGNHDVSVRSVSTNNGDFISTGGRNFTANWDINTGTGIVDLNHTGGNVTLKGHVTASTFQSDGGNLTVSNTKDIKVSSVLGSGEGIDINHTGIVNMAGTDLVSTAAGASINIVAGNGNHDVSVRSVSTNNGDFISTGGRNFTANWDINTGTGAVDLNHSSIGDVTLKGHVTAGTFQSDGRSLTVSNTKDIKVSGVLGSGEGIDINHAGTVNLAGTDLVSTAAGASIDIVAGNGGSHDVSVRSVTTNNGDFNSTGGRSFTANWDINTGTGIVDLDHSSGNVELKGHVTAGAFESNGINLSVTNNKDINVSGNKGGFGINATHTGIVNLAGTDLVSTESFAAINLQAGAGNHDMTLKTATTNDGAITTAGGRHLTLNGNLNAGSNAVNIVHSGNVNLGTHDVTGGSVFISASGTLNGSGASTVSGEGGVTLLSMGNLTYTGEIIASLGAVDVTSLIGSMSLGDVTSLATFTATASTVTLFGTLDFGVQGLVVGNFIVASSGELVFDLIAPGNTFDSLLVTGDMTLNAGNTVTVDVGNPSIGLDTNLPVPPLASVFGAGGLTGSISNLQLQGDPAETAKIDDVFADPLGIFMDLI